MKSSKIHFIIFLLFFSSFMIRAEVFSLAPFSRKGGGAGGDIATALGGRKLWSEPIVVNGLKSGMRLTLLENNLEECFLTIKKQFPKAIFKVSRGALLIDIKGKNGSVERLYLVELDGVYPVMQFSMYFPKGLPKDAEWPKKLPLPASSTPQTIISLPDREVIYGTFSTSLPVGAAMSDVSATLTSNGWKNMKEGVFLKSNPLSITLISFSEDDNGKTRGFILKRLL